MKALLKVVMADIVLVAFAIGVLADEQWRAYYATRGGLQPSTEYSILTQYFSMKTVSTTLTSPPTLSWIQVIIVSLVLVNGIYLYRLAGHRSPTCDQVPTSS